MSYTFQIKTLGCPVNQQEGRGLAEAMIRAGFIETTGSADVYIVNSCVVTRAAAAEARRLAAKARRENPEALVVLAGCYPQVYREEIAEKLPGVDLITGTAGRAKLPALISRRLAGEPVERLLVTPHGPDETFEELPVVEHYGRTRPVIKIQEGCDEACTYCIVRVARGLPRSLAPKKVLARVRRFVEQGYREVILAGTHLGTYGKDIPGWNLARLIREISRLPGDFRLRLDYVEPMDVNLELLEAMAAPSRVCPFLYLPLQSGSDRVLQRMGRRYTAGDYARLVLTARELIPGLSLWTDLIAGFPGEREEDHRQTLQFVEGLALSHLHVFPYSPRPGTAAATFPDQVAPDVKKKRVDELRALDRELSLRFHRQQVGKQVQVLVEKIKNGQGEGFSEHYVRVRFPATDPEMKGRLIPVQVTAARQWGVEGHIPR
ncbi:MAG TPA: tRNA (N(6)-L-threonylcarbamoyladenosine(37)-C(2))-methylthiotransferase MtaB [Desulfotomaculum sp.]|nr:tRNA (N(6)-L-threonylcarbamoyladenosine(37)-C(2))-methylthiotransferase MtaB [Desulfotomaculum sp.]